MTEPMDVEEALRLVRSVAGVHANMNGWGKQAPLWEADAVLAALGTRLARDREVVRKVREEMGGWRTESAPENPFTSMGNIYYSRVDGWLALLDSILEPERAKETT